MPASGTEDEAEKLTQMEISSDANMPNSADQMQALVAENVKEPQMEASLSEVEIGEVNVATEVEAQSAVEKSNQYHDLEGKEIVGPKLISAENVADQSWMDQCWFKCRKCKTLMNSKAEFASHIKGQHDIASVKKNHKMFGNPCHQLKLATCIPCNCVIMFEREALSFHIEKFHKELPLQNIQRLFDI